MPATRITIAAASCHAARRCTVTSVIGAAIAVRRLGRCCAAVGRTSLNDRDLRPKWSQAATARAVTATVTARGRTARSFRPPAVANRRATAVRSRKITVERNSPSRWRFRPPLLRTLGFALRRLLRFPGAASTYSRSVLGAVPNLDIDRETGKASPRAICALSEDFVPVDCRPRPRKMSAGSVGRAVRASLRLRATARRVGAPAVTCRGRRRSDPSAARG
jgi:hypothetical protein